MTDTPDVKTVTFGTALQRMESAAVKRSEAIARIHENHAERQAAIAKARTDGTDLAPARRTKSLGRERAVVTRPGIPGLGLMLGQDTNGDPAFFSVDNNTGILFPFDMKIEDMLASDWVVL